MSTPDRRKLFDGIDAVSFKENQPKKNRKWLWFSIGTVALVLITVFAVFIYKNIYTNLHVTDAKIAAHVLTTTTVNTEEGDLVYAPYKSGIVLASRSEVCYYNTKGEPEWKHEINLLNPFIKVNGSYVLIAGRNTKDYLLIHNGKIVIEANTTYNILNAGVARNGTFFLVEDEPYYKGRLVIRDSKNKDKFVWHSGSSYILDVTFNDRASQIAITTLSAIPQTANAQTQDASYSSAVLLFKLHETAPYKTYNFENSMATSIYYAGGRYIVVTDTHIRAYSGLNGAQSWQYALTPDALVRISFYTDKLAVLTQAEDATQTLHILKTDGKCIGKLENLKNTGDISLTGNIIAVEGGSTLSVYRTNAKHLYDVTLPKTYDDICLFANGQNFLGANNIVFDILLAK